MRQRDRVEKIGLGQFGLAHFDPQCAAVPQSVGPKDELLWVRLKGELHCVECLTGRAIKGLSLRQTSEHIRIAHPCPSLFQPGQGLADQGYAFARTAGLRSRPANYAAGQITSIRKTMFFG